MKLLRPANLSHSTLKKPHLLPNYLKKKKKKNIFPLVSSKTPTNQVKGQKRNKNLAWRRYTYQTPHFGETFLFPSNFGILHQYSQ